MSKESRKNVLRARGERVRKLFWRKLKVKFIKIHPRKKSIFHFLPVKVGTLGGCEMWTMETVVFFQTQRKKHCIVFEPAREEEQRDTWQWTTSHELNYLDSVYSLTMGPRGNMKRDKTYLNGSWDFMPKKHNRLVWVKLCEEKLHNTPISHNNKKNWQIKWETLIMVTEQSGTVGVPVFIWMFLAH